MSYEQEQAEYKEQLDKVIKRIKELDNIFAKHPALKYKYSSNRDRCNSQEEYLKIILQSNYGDYNTYNDSVYMLEYRLCQHKKSDLEMKLNESKSDRNISKALDYIDGITPKHVSGRVYEVKDGDGCATFCLWFIIIDAIVVFLYYLISGGN